MFKKFLLKFLSITELTPIKDWHTNNVLKGHKNKDGIVVIPDLPITQLGEKLVSIWYTSSILTRLKFLITGKVNFQIAAPTHAPIAISIGEYERNEEKKEA